MKAGSHINDWFNSIHAQIYACFDMSSAIAKVCLI